MDFFFIEQFAIGLLAPSEPANGKKKKKKDTYVGQKQGAKGHIVIYSENLSMCRFHGMFCFLDENYYGRELHKLEDQEVEIPGRPKKKEIKDREAFKK